MIFLSFWSKLENDKIMISAFIANGNALREVVELLGHVCLNFTLFLTCYFFDMLFFALREVVELLGHVCLNFTLFHFICIFLMKYTPCSTWTSGCYHFWTSLWFERIILKHKKTYFYVFWTSKYTVNLSHKNFLNFSSPSTWTSSNHFFVYELFLKVQQMSLCFLYFEQVNPRF